MTRLSLLLCIAFVTDRIACAGEPDRDWKELEAQVAQLEEAEGEEARAPLRAEVFERAGKFLDLHLAKPGEAERCQRAARWWIGLTRQQKATPEQIAARIATLREKLAPLPPQLERELKLAEVRLTVRPGAPAPAWRARPVGDGPEVASEELRGKLVLLDFWATWCGPCLKLASTRLLPLQAKHGPKLAIVGVGASTNGDTREKQARIAERMGTHWTKVFDQEERISQAFGVDSWPYLVLIDPEGKVLLAGAGAEVIDEVEQLVGERLAAPPPEKKR